ncbi:MAG: ribonuclease HI [Clostridia bacterium]
MKEVTVYTDGACSGNPGPGGYAAILSYGNFEKTVVGGEPETTNNRMELKAAIMGLKALKEPCSVKLCTDSAYLCGGFRDGWVNAWRKNNWLKVDKKPVLNKELWLELLTLSEVHNISWVKVKGHSDNEFNNRCDALARAEIDKLKDR